MLFLLQFAQKIMIVYVSIIPLDVSFYVVHDILVRGFFEPEDLHRPKIWILGQLHKVKLVLEIFFFLHRGCFAHMIVKSADIITNFINERTLYFLISTCSKYLTSIFNECIPFRSLFKHFHMILDISFE
jgi:hypothetical protein